MTNGFTQTVDDRHWKRWAHRYENVAVGMEYELDDWKVIVYGRSDAYVLKRGLGRDDAERLARRWMRDYAGGKVTGDLDFTGAGN